MAHAGSRIRNSEGARLRAAPRRGLNIGFTLIEMLMVMAIIAIVTAVTLPSLVRSIRGNRLRAASRTVVQMGRYARSMAVLHQQEMVLTFDLAGGGLSARPGGSAEVAAAGAAGIETDAEPEPSAQPDIAPALVEPDEAESGQAKGGAGLSGMETVTRRLDQVAIESVAVGEDPATRTTSREGIAIVVYASNGRCRPYSVVLRDQFGAGVRVDVDALASAQTEPDKSGGGGP